MKDGTKREYHFMGKRLVQYFFLFFASLPYLWWNVASLFLGVERAFQGSSQFCALFPGTIGSLFRAAFYRLSLPGSSQKTVIGFLSTFADPRAKLEKHVSSGVCCNIGWAHIGEHCIIGSHVCITSGKNQHAFETPDIPIRLQGGEKKQIIIGRDCWIGASAVIMADIGEGSVIAAGSIVVDPVPPYSIAAGNPAKIIKSRPHPDDTIDLTCFSPNNYTSFRVMHLTVALRVGGAERLALDLLRADRECFGGLIAGMYLEPGPLRHLANTDGIPNKALHYDGKNRLVCIFSLWRELRSRHIALLHVHAEYLLPIAIPAAFLARVPLVFTVHSKHTVETMPTLRFFMRLMTPFLHNIVCVSSPLKEYYVHKLGYPSQNVRIIQNGIDTRRFTPQGDKAVLPWKDRNGLFIFGNVARLHEAKGIDNLIRAFAAVYANHPQTRLLIVGDGELRVDMETLITELHLAHVAHITGIRSDIPQLLRNLDIFTLSSRHEGMPLAVLEAMACGIPVISTRVGDIERLNQDTCCVALVPPENPIALTAEMTALMRDESRRNTFAHNGMLKIQKYYSMKKTATEYFALYRENGICFPASK